MLQDTGFVKIHRQIVNWEWYDDINVFKVFLHLLITVNYEDKKWQGITIPRGSKVTSLSNLAKETKLSVKQVRVALNKLKMTGEVASKVTSKYTLLSIVKYNDFQENKKTNGTQKGKQEDTQMANEGQSEGKQRATTKEYKEIKKEKKDKEDKNIYGEFQNVKLTASELEKLKETFGTTKTDKAITFLDEYIAEKNYKSASHYLAIRRWVINAVDTKETKQTVGNNTNNALNHNLELLRRL